MQPTAETWKLKTVIAHRIGQVRYLGNQLVPMRVEA